MVALAPDRRDLVGRGALALARARPEAAPRVVAALLRVAFPGSRCDVLARRRKRDRRAWIALAHRPASQPRLDAEAEGMGLPASGQHESKGAAAADTRLPGSAHLLQQDLPHRLVEVIRAPEIKAILSVARRDAFSDDERALLGALSQACRGSLVTWARMERYRRTLRRARFLQRLLGDATRSMETADIADAALRRLRSQMPVDRLLLVEPSSEAGEILTWIVEFGAAAACRRQPGRAASEARRATLRDAAALSEIPVGSGDPWLEDALASGMRSHVLLPLESRRRHPGALILQSRQVQGLGSEHLPLLWHVARPLSSALERALLFREASERSRQMTALYEVGQALNSPLDTAGVTERVLSALHDAFRFQHSAVLTLEVRDDGEWLVMQASRGYSLRDEGNFRMRVGDRGVTSRAVRSGRLVYVPDVRQDPHYVKGVESGRSEVAVPLIVAGRVVGVLDVESTQLNAFSASDLETLKLFSTQVALALERARSFDDVRRQAMTDGLTGLLNQRYFKEKVDRELDRSRRTRRPFVLTLIDVDDFKSVNDVHGHVAGDQVITAMGDVLRARIRSIDAAARFGGDEFALILSEADLAQGLRIAEEVRLDILERKPAGIPISLSMGVAEWSESLVSFRDIVNAADRALYRAKALGKGRVEAHEPEAGA